MRLSRLSDRQLRRLIRNADVRFGNDEIKKASESAEDIEQNLAKEMNISPRAKFLWKVVQKYKGEPEIKKLEFTISRAKERILQACRFYADVARTLREYEEKN